MEHGSIRVSVARLICRTYVSAGPGFISIYVEQYAKQATARWRSLLRDSSPAPPPWRVYRALLHFVINSFDLYRRRTRNANSYLLISRACGAAGWPILFYRLSAKRRGAARRNVRVNPPPRVHSSRSMRGLIHPLEVSTKDTKQPGRCASARNTADN